MVESNASLDLTPRPPETTIGAEERSGRSDLTISSEIHCDCSVRSERSRISKLRAHRLRFLVSDHACALHQWRLGDLPGPTFSASLTSTGASLSPS